MSRQHQNPHHHHLGTSSHHAGASSQHSVASNSEQPSNAAVVAAYQHHEDRLFRAWRSVAHSVVVVTSKAEKAAPVAAARDADPAVKKACLREVDEAVVGFLRNRIEWGRLISALEAKLEGKAVEMENLQQYVRCQPGLGRKRKRGSIIETASAAVSPPTAATTSSSNQGFTAAAQETATDTATDTTTTSDTAAAVAVGTPTGSAGPQ